MFPSSIYDEVTSASSYSRGFDLARLGHVEAYSPDYFDGDDSLVQVEATVRGSEGARYSTWVTLDLEDETVDSYDCTCPAAAKYYGMCKHSVAVALTYLNDLGMLHLGYAPVKQASAPAPKRTVYERPTSSVMAQFLSERSRSLQRRALTQAVQATPRYDANDPKAPTEPVGFVVTIARWSSYYGYGENDMWELRLKVKSGKASYVVKSMTKLVNAWKSGDYVDYGKNLAFVHTRAAFSDRANALLEVVADIVSAQQAALQSKDRYLYGTTMSTGKELPLSAQEAVRVLDVMVGADVFYEPMGRYERKKARPCPVVPAEALDYPVRLAASADGGYDLALPPDDDVIVAGDVAYILHPDCIERVEGDAVVRAAPLLNMLVAADLPSIHIHDKDMPAFCSAALPLLGGLRGFEAPDGLDELMPPAPEFAFRLGMADGYVVCAASVAYGEVVLGLFESAAPGQPARDLEREIEAQQVVRAYFPYGDTSTPDYDPNTPSFYRTMRAAQAKAQRMPGEPDLPWFPDEDDESLYLLLTDGLRQFAALGEVFLSERLRGVEIRQAPEIKVQASARAGLLDLEVAADGLSAADLLNYLASYRRRQRYVRLTNGDIMRLGEGVGAISGLADGLGIADDALVRGTAQLPSNRTLFVDALMKDAPGVRFDRNRAFRQIVRSFDTVADSDFVEPEGLRDVLRPYQRTGFKWLSTLAALGFGGILADDMGLGKTVQLIAVFEARKRDLPDDGGEPAPSLVVCPASLVYNWMAELERFSPSLRAVPVVGAKQQRSALIAQSAQYDVLVTSYDLMKRDIEAYEKRSFDIVALDEAQYIKNASTQSAKAAKRLPAKVRFALTGTPIENRLAELWSIFDFLMPGILGSHESFARRFEKPIDAGEEGVAQRLQKLVAPFILRRLKRDVLSDLPEKNESVVYAVMEGEQKKLYDANVAKLAMSLASQLPEEFAQNKLAVLAELMRLRQLCCDPHLVYENYAHGSAKLDACADLVASAIEGGHKVLLFSQFTSMLDLIAARLERDGVGYLMLTGATSKERRVRLVAEFQEGDVPVFLISLKAGGVGLNLTAADIVIHFDPWWNTAAQDQATDRAHRIGQTRDVSVFKLIAKGTIEEKIVEMQEAKRDLADSIIGGEGVSSAKLTREDVLALIE